MFEFEIAIADASGGASATSMQKTCNVHLTEHVSFPVCSVGSDGKIVHAVMERWLIEAAKRQCLEQTLLECGTQSFAHPQTVS